MEDLFRALPALLKEFDENETLREAVVFAAWQKAAGKSLAQHAVPFRLYQKHLVIAVANEMWKRHLESLSGQMIFQLNSLLRQAAVTYIEFRVDEKTVGGAKRKNSKNYLSPEQLEEKALDEVSINLRNSADAIEDDNLRYQFLLAAGSCLARKKILMKKN
ncbi:hypothetical protein BH20ACI4_BH20ACI4_16560 [soil metagenome]